MDFFELTSALERDFSTCADFKHRSFTLKNGKKAYICAFKDLTSRSYISERIILPLIVTEDVKDIISTVQTTVVMEETDIEKIKSAILFGSALVVLYDNVTTISALCPADEGGGRDIQEPNSDVTIRGPRAGFTEDYEKNVAAIRRIIRNENLAFEEFTLKGNTHTRVVLSYIEGVANENVVKCIRQKLTSLDAVGIVDSANLEMFISGRMLFPIFGSTEKVDKFASKLLSGRVGIIVDGSPFVMTAPYVFAESIQSAEDYLKSPVYSTFMRLLRFLALFISLYFPSMYITVLKYAPELLPDKVTDILKQSREGMPLEPFFEILLMLIVFEILREVGVRMPRTVGDAVGIVGSIIIGDAATEAGLASTVVVVVVAITAVCTFIIPAYMNAQLIFRFVFLFAGYFFSFFGVIIASLLLLSYLACKTSFGISYLSPLSPVSFQGMLDFIISVPSVNLKRRDRF